MTESTTLTIHLPNETGHQLARLADRTRRTPGTLAAEAVAAYVAAELAAVDGIELGRADLRAGRVTPHEEVVREARAVIEAARAGR